MQCLLVLLDDAGVHARSELLDVELDFHIEMLDDIDGDDLVQHLPILLDGDVADVCFEPLDAEVNVHTELPDDVVLPLSADVDVAQDQHARPT